MGVFPSPHQSWKVVGEMLTVLRCSNKVSLEPARFVLREQPTPLCLSLHGYGFVAGTIIASPIPSAWLGETNV